MRGRSAFYWSLITRNYYFAAFTVEAFVFTM